MLAGEHGCTLCTFGDLVRVPGTSSSLQKQRGAGAKVKVVYAPSDAVEYAAAHPGEQVVFLSVGFETTTPSACLALKRAEAQDIANFSLLTANKTMPAAYEAMASHTDAYLYPGHVCAVMGTGDCEAMVQQGVSGVVAGFTAKELMTAFAVILKKIRQGRPFFKNCYPRVVTREGSRTAKELMADVMVPCDDEWRGLGCISQSGLRLRPDYAAWDARRKYSVPPMKGKVNPVCRCGDILQGKCTPPQCPLFGTVCTPEQPVGACMVSHEGACSAYYTYGGKIR